MTLKEKIKEYVDDHYKYYAYNNLHELSNIF